MLSEICAFAEIVDVFGGLTTRNTLQKGIIIYFFQYVLIFLYLIYFNIKILYFCSTNNVYNLMYKSPDGRIKNK